MITNTKLHLAVPQVIIHYINKENTPEASKKAVLLCNYSVTNIVDFERKFERKLNNQRRINPDILKKPEPSSHGQLIVIRARKDTIGMLCA